MTCDGDTVSCTPRLVGAVHIVATSEGVWFTRDETEDRAAKIELQCAIAELSNGAAAEVDDALARRLRRRRRHRRRRLRSAQDGGGGAAGGGGTDDGSGVWRCWDPESMAAVWDDVLVTPPAPP